MKIIADSRDREAWLAARRELFGSSDCADLLRAGYVDKKLSDAEVAAAGNTAYKLVIMRKAGMAEEFQGNETTEMGKDFEPSFVNMAKRKWGWNMVPFGMLVQDRVCPRLGATPDFIVDSPWGRGLVQTKLTTAQAQEDCKPQKNGDPSTATYANGPPSYYLVQKQAELAVMDLEWNSLLVLHCANGQFKGRLYPVRRHDGVIERIRYEATRAWELVERLKNGEHVEL